MREISIPIAFEEISAPERSFIRRDHTPLAPLRPVRDHGMGLMSTMETVAEISISGMFSSRLLEVGA